MIRQSLTKAGKTFDGVTFAIAIFFLFLGIFVLWLLKTWLNMQQDVVLISLVLIPVFVYMIFSGRLQEIHGPGGLGATFMAVAKTSLDINESNAERIEVGQVGIIEKGGMLGLQQVLQKVGNPMYLILTVTLGKVDHYKETALLNYLKALSQYRNFTFLVILEQDEEVYAYVAGWRATQILEMEMGMGSHDFVGAINQGLKQDLSRYELVKMTVRATDTNIDVLKKMTDLKMDALIVTDEEGKLKGVVERELVLSKLMLAIAKSAT